MAMYLEPYFGGGEVAEMGSCGHFDEKHAKRARAPDQVQLCTVLLPEVLSYRNLKHRS